MHGRGIKTRFSPSRDEKRHKSQSGRLGESAASPHHERPGGTILLAGVLPLSVEMPDDLHGSEMEVRKDGGRIF